MAILRHQGLPAAFGILMFVPRDSPFRYQPRMVKVPQNKTMKKVRTYLERYRQASRVETEKDVWELVKARPCKLAIQPEFQGCPWNNNCCGKDKTKPMYFHALEARTKVASRLPILTAEELAERDKEIA